MNLKTIPVGTKFGRWKTTSEIYRCPVKKRRVIDCECSCKLKTKKTMEWFSLTSGASTTCGCLGRYDMEGKEYGRLTVQVVYKQAGRKHWVADCVCSCPDKTETTVQIGNLVSGHTTSCGCHHQEVCTKHGMSGTLLYSRWEAMLGRTGAWGSKENKDYEGRGIGVCEEWLEFRSFMEWALANGFKEHLELDRRDNSGSYHPDNCRWVTRVQNANNKQLLNKRNSSGYRGVHYCNTYKCWFGRIKSSLIPPFKSTQQETAEAAARLRDLHVIAHSGHTLHSIPLNFPEMSVQP
jgi:hypothetical protein